MNNKYILTVNRREARPRAERLRKLGGGRSGGGSTVVQMQGGGGSSYTPTYDSSLDTLLVDAENYLQVKTPEGREKAKAGYADNAGQWEGKTFGEYLDQPVRTTDSVTFKTVKAGAVDVQVQCVQHIGGKQLLTVTRCVAEEVVNTGTHWRVYFSATDAEGRAVNNDWQPGDLAIMQTFNMGVNRFYWRYVNAKGTADGKHYIVLDGVNKAEGSDDPEVGDVIVQFGNLRKTAGRTSAIVLSGAGDDSPSIALYTDIVGYSIPKASVNIKPGESVFSGTLKADRYIVTRFAGDDTEIYKTVNGAYITGRGNYILPDLEEGEMVVVKWFNPPYSSRYGASKFKVENPLTAGIAVASDAGTLNYYQQVTFNMKPALLYEIIGDRPVGSTKTYWSIIKAGTTVAGDISNVGNESMEPFPDINVDDLMPTP